jgi:hypothetical protein
LSAHSRNACLKPTEINFWPYAVAPTAQTWRRLRPLLLSFAGPTVTTFSGVPIRLDPSDPAELILVKAGAFAAARLETPSRYTMWAARGLAGLVKAVGRAPSDAPRPAASAGSLLADLDMCLAAGDRNGTDRYFAVLRDEWRLDAVNLRFVEVHIASVFREWPQLVAQPWFNDLCHISRPIFVTQALLEALWQTRLLPFAEDPAELRRRYQGDLRGVCVDLLDELPKRTDGAAAIADLEREIGGVPPGEAALRSDEPPAATGWLGWIEAAASGRMRDPASGARTATTEQTAASTNEADAGKIASGLEELAFANEGRQSLLAALPELVRWLVNDPGFPRSAMRPLYEAALTIFTLLEERGRPTRDALLQMLDALLSLGPGPDAYRRYLQDVTTFVSPEAGTSVIYWLIELAETLVRNPASDGPARLSLLNAILASLQPISGLLTAAQRAAYKRVATIAQWPSLADAPASPGSPSAPSDALKGKFVVLYTLTESAGRQASEAVLEAYPGVRVEVTNDVVCTPRLRTLARDADLVVLATASAKHAATDCFQRHRAPGSPIAYAAGRGATSMLRAVEDSVGSGKTAMDTWSR